MTDEGRLHDLLLRWEEDALTPEELEEITRLLESSQDARGELIRQWMLSSSISEGLDRRPEAFKKTRRTLRRGFLRPQKSYWVPASIAAAALFALIMYAAAPGPNPSRETARRNSQEVQDPTPVVEGPAPEPQRVSVVPAPVPPSKPPEVEERPKKDPAPVEPVKAPEPPAKPLLSPAPPKEPEPAPAATKPETVVSEATLGHVEGNVVVVAGASRTPVKRGQGIFPGQSLVTEEGKGLAVLFYTDGTRIELGPGAELRLAAERGKKFEVVRGALTADVARQPKERPMVVATPHGEAVVLGTTLRILVDSDAIKGTRLEVVEGRVQLKRKLDGKVVEVPSGHFAIAAPGAELAPARPLARVSLPADRTCPVIYLNNNCLDCYSDEYVMALASVGDIQLRGMITCTDLGEEELLNNLSRRTALVAKARRSGLRNIPDPVLGILGIHSKPSSGRIEDTKPVGSPGSSLIVREARKATARKPLVIVSGGALTTVADAYLLDPSIGDKVVVATFLERVERTKVADPWGTYIVLEKLRSLLVSRAIPNVISVPTSRVTELPDTELRAAMIEKETGPNPSIRRPNQVSGNEIGLIALMRPEFCLKEQRKSFDRWLRTGTAALKDDPNGRIWVITDLDPVLGTQEFWRALEKPAAWNPAK